MTTNVVTASPDTAIGDIAALLIDNRISAVPIVTADGELIGILTESDLLHRAETGTERKRKWWLEALTGPDKRAREFIKSHAMRAEDAMSRLVVTVPENAELGEVAALLDRHRIRRVPVVRDGKVVGIISKTDLVRALALMPMRASPQRYDDAALHKAIYDAIRAQPWMNSLYMSFTVTDGTVGLVGFVDSADQRSAVRTLVEGVSGVRNVVDHLKVRTPWTRALPTFRSPQAS